MRSNPAFPFLPPRSRVARSLSVAVILQHRGGIGEGVFAAFYTASSASPSWLSGSVAPVDLPCMIGSSFASSRSLGGLGKDGGGDCCCVEALWVDRDWER